VITFGSHAYHITTALLDAHEKQHQARCAQLTQQEPFANWLSESPAFISFAFLARRLLLFKITH